MLCLFDLPLNKNRKIVVGDLFLGFSWVIFIFIFQFHVCSKGLFFSSNFQTSVLQIMNLDLGPRPLTVVWHSFFLVVLAKASRM